MKTLLIIAFFLGIMVSGIGAPVDAGSKIPDYPHVTSLSGSEYFVLSLNPGTRAVQFLTIRHDATQGLATISYVTQFVNSATGSVATITILNNTSNALVSVINATNTALIATINATSNSLVTIFNSTVNTASNFLFGVSGTNVTVGAGTNTIVETNVIGLQTVYKVSSALNTNSVGTNTAGILASNNVRVAAGANVTVTTNSSGGVSIYTVASTASGVTEIQTNGVRVGLVTNINFTAGVTGSVSASTAILGVSASGGALSGTASFFNLSPQAGKLPSTNMIGFENGYQDWEPCYYKTNAEGSIASTYATWQFVMPPDYATNTLSFNLLTTLIATNGPNSSNTIFRISFVRCASGDSTDIRTASFSTAVSGTNTWTASGTGTNKVLSLTINMGTQALGSNDLCILKVDRDAANDTFGGGTSLVGLQGRYTR